MAKRKTPDTGFLMDRTSWYRVYSTERGLRKAYGAQTPTEDVAKFALHLMRPGGPVKKLTAQDAEALLGIVLGGTSRTPSCASW